MTAKKKSTDERSEEQRLAAFLRRMLRDGRHVTGVDWILEPEDDPDFPTTAVERQRELDVASLVRGVLFHSSVVVVDELFMDIDRLRGGDDVDDTMMLVNLPERYGPHYDVMFAQRFLVATVAVTMRLTSGWHPLASTAEELALQLILEHADMTRELFDLDLAEGWEGMLTDSLLEDLDFMHLFDADSKFLAKPDKWFVPFNPSYRSAPYVLDAE
jgi:hypothetical protein